MIELAVLVSVFKTFASWLIIGAAIQTCSELKRRE